MVREVNRLLSRFLYFSAHGSSINQPSHNVLESARLLAQKTLLSKIRQSPLYCNRTVAMLNS
jgi:hypothetical protein